MTPLRALPLLLLLALLLAPACKPEVKSTGPGQAATPEKTPQATTQKPPFVLEKLQLTQAEGLLHPNAPTLEQAQSWIRQSLLAEPEFTDDLQHGGPRVSVQGSYRATWEDAGDGSGQRLGAVFFELEVRPSDGSRDNRYEISAFVGEALKDGQPPTEGLRALVQSVGQEVTGSLARQARAHHATDEALVRFLAQDKDVELLKAAIPKLRQRRVTQAAPGLIKLLKHPEREIVNLAAGALGDVGDRAAVPALIEAGSRVEPADRLPVIYALGELGGPDAVSYLEALRGSDVHPSLYTPIDNALSRAKSK